MLVGKQQSFFLAAGSYLLWRFCDVTAVPTFPCFRLILHTTYPHHSEWTQTHFPRTTIVTRDSVLFQPHPNTPSPVGGPPAADPPPLWPPQCFLRFHTQRSARGTRRSQSTAPPGETLMDIFTFIKECNGNMSYSRLGC